MPISCGFLGSPHARQELVDLGPSTTVSVGLDPTWTKDQRRAPTPDRPRIPALIDTGALESCIDTALASALALPIVDKRPVAGAVGNIRANVCLAQVHVEALHYTIEGQFALLPLAQHIGYNVVLGRTFLRHCMLIYNGKIGEVTLEVNK